MPRQRSWVARLAGLTMVGGLLAGALGPVARVAADHTPPPDMVVVVGTLQSEAGCPGDWQPECEATALTYDSANDVWTGTFTVEPGDDQDNRGPRYKVALNGTWDENYGAEATQGGADIPLVVSEPTEVTFVYNHNTHEVLDSVGSEIVVGEPPPLPEKVVVPGTHQSELGCAGDWLADCDATALAYDEEDDVWQGTFLIEPDNDQDDLGPRYKAALNGSWDVNFGANASPGGGDIPLVVSEPTEVKFYFDHKTNWVTDSFNQVIAVAMGTFQSELGCASDNDPGCLRSWLQDPSGSGRLSFATDAIPPGDYEVMVALGESDAETYGEAGAPIAFSVEEDSEVFIGYDPENNEVTVSTEGAPRGDLSKAKAQWVTRDTLAWQVDDLEGASYRLYHAAQGGLALEPGALDEAEFVTLTRSGVGLPARITINRPQLLAYAVFKLDAADVERVPELLKGQLAVAAVNENGRVLDATGVQIADVLDDVYKYGGALGVTYAGEAPTLRVWAPTAQSVSVVLYDSSTAEAGETVPMTWDVATGVWTAAGTADWTGKFYLYQVDVYVPATGQVERNLVTDPYSFSLSTNSLRSQVVNLDDPALKPEGWESVAKPPLATPEDIVIYELHVRDFSVADESVPEELRGTYLAFAETESAGMQHLRALAEAGLTHLHLLPVFDIASVDEDKANWRHVDEAALAALPPDSQEQQLAVQAIREQDPFNWGYDPLHYTAPEGSYATDPDGAARIREFRAMVQALNGIGLRVVMDVVYNHTNASGQSPKSVLDKIVPGYYHRLNADGRVETSTCCQNTATEHAMMEKLMVDSLVTWATAYKVDGFRFDLMGHHMLANMVNVRAALDGLTPEAHGVAGEQIYVYGEGWDFGEVAANARGKNATQLNIGGSGIGVFNDRLRDAARGGGPFGAKPEQGFLTGLLLAPSDFDQGDEPAQRAKLLRYSDWIRVGLAGNLADYQLVNAAGRTVPGERIDYNGSPAGYTQDPEENIIYISAHDNETLFDAIQWKAPASAGVAERVRMNNLGVSLVLLAQGVPFFHAGDDLLRSKSLDGNSYNSGDWFNRVDWTRQSNNWGVGLPNFATELWDAMGVLLGNPALKPGPADIEAAHTHFREWLQIRRSSRLFRLQTADEVQQRLAFYNTGPEQLPGLIVMALENSGEGRLPDAFDRVVALVNASPEAQTFADPAFAGTDLVLHPILQESSDPVAREASFDAVAGSFSVPGRTAAVFVVISNEPLPTATMAATQVAQATAAPPTRQPTATTMPAATQVGQAETPAQPAATATAVTQTTTGGPGLGILLGIGALLVAGLGAAVVWARRKRA